MVPPLLVSFSTERVESGRVGRVFAQRKPRSSDGAISDGRSPPKKSDESVEINDTSKTKLNIIILIDFYSLSYL